MTDNNKNDVSIQSNQEIVDELTKDLESSILDDSKHSPDSEDKFFDAEKDSDEEVEKDKAKCPLNDFIDEEKLKETDDQLTDEEKEKRKTDANILKQQGNEEFKNENYVESVAIYTSALILCPLQYKNERSILYSNRSVSKIKLEYKESALEDITKALELNPDYVKALYRRAKLYKDMDKLDECLEDYKKLQTLDPSNKEIPHIMYVLSQKIEKRNEEMKTEMLGKLKDLGNLILKPFGLSTENFQLNQDPNSGGYSVNFVQKQ